MEITPGNYTASPIDCGISETKSGKPQVFVTFLIPQIEKKITWFGGLSSDKAIEITGAALIRCGFRGTDLTALTSGIAVLNQEKQVELVIENDEWEGKVYTRVKWVNEIGGGMKDKLDQAGAAQKMAGYNIAGTMIRLQQEMGISSAKPTQQNNTAQQQTGFNSAPPF